jgi:hypothetical protein
MATANLTTAEPEATDASSAAPDTVDGPSTAPAPPASMVERMTAIMDAFDHPSCG